MTDTDLYLLASEAPGVLDETPLRVHYQHPAANFDPLAPTYAWSPGVWLGDGFVVSEDNVCADFGNDVADEDRAWLRLDLRLPEVRDRLVRWLHEHGKPVGWTGLEWNVSRDDPAALLAEVREVGATLESLTSRS